MCCIFLRSFYGEDCCQYHRTGPNPCLKSICKTFKKCPESLRKVVKSNRGDRRSLLAKYRWGVAKCQVCKEYVNIKCHKCCFQPAEKERRRARWNRTGRGRFSFVARPMKMRTQECFKIVDGWHHGNGIAGCLCQISSVFIGQFQFHFKINSI